MPSLRSKVASKIDLIWVKEHQDLIAACDSELIGKTFEEGNKVLEIKESFYKGYQCSPSDLKKIVDKYPQSILVGKRTIKAVFGKIPEKVYKVNTIPYCIVVKF
ncbi:MAG: DUF424 family protein [archaeon]